MRMKICALFPNRPAEPYKIVDGLWLGGIFRNEAEDLSGGFLCPSIAQLRRKYESAFSHIDDERRRRRLIEGHITARHWDAAEMNAVAAELTKDIFAPIALQHVTLVTQGKREPAFTFENGEGRWIAFDRGNIRQQIEQAIDLIATHILQERGGERASGDGTSGAPPEVAGS